MGADVPANWDSLADAVTGTTGLPFSKVVAELRHLKLGKNQAYVIVFFWLAVDLHHALGAGPGWRYRQSVRVDISAAAADYIASSGGQVWVWASRPRMCCAGSPAWMHAAVTAPDGLTGFRQLSADAAPGLTVYFRTVGGQQPDVLELDMEGRRQQKVAAYWDGCLMAMAG